MKTTKVTYQVGDTYSLADVWLALNAEGEVVEPLHDMGYSLSAADSTQQGCSTAVGNGTSFVLSVEYTGYVCAWYKGKRLGNHFIFVEK